MKKLFYAALALTLYSTMASVFAQPAPPKGFTHKITDAATGVECTHWAVESDQRDYKNSRLTVVVGGYPSAAARDGKKNPVCSRTFNLGADQLGGKKLGVLTLDDVHALVKTAQPSGFFVPPTPSGTTPVAPPAPPFKDAKTE